MKFKNISLFFFVFVLFACNKDKNQNLDINFVVSGFYNNVPENTYIYLVNRKAQNTVLIDSALITDSVFNLKGNIKDSEDFYFIKLSNSDYFVHLIAKAGDTIKLRVDYNKPQNYKILNPQQSEAIQKIENHIFIINSQIKATEDIEKIDSLKKIQINYSLNFLSEQDTTLAAIIALSEKFITGEPVIPIEKYLQLYQDTEKKLRHRYLDLDHYSSFVEFIKNYEISVLRDKPIDFENIKPDKIQNFSSKTILGEDFNLANLKGKKILLVFWASWCVPCSYNNKVLKRIAENYKDIEIVQISLDNNIEILKDTLSVYGFEHYLINDENVWGSEIAKQYVVNNLPTNILIDQKGNIILHSSNTNDLFRFFEKIK